MTAELAALLAQDGIANGAIYVLAALGIVLVFLVTRVIFVPFGDLVACTALTLATLEERRLPGTLWLVPALAVLAFAFEAVTLWRAGAAARLPRAALAWLALPVLPVVATLAATRWDLPDGVLVALTVALVLPLGPLLHRVVFRPIADAPVLVLLIVAVALHFALSGLMLIAFGPEGMRPRLLLGGAVEIGGLVFTGQMLLMLGTSAAMSLLLWLFFEHTMPGRALRATAVNRVGARLMGIRPAGTGAVAFLLAAGLAGVAGVLIGPINTLAYESGFIIGLKAFVGAIIGGLASYPGAVAGALFVGLLESFTAFWDSQLKEVVVFASLLPVLVLRSLLAGGGADENEAEEEL
ncbi:Branched-chain amino acid ABC transporter permease [Rhodovastum atsumiense]|uniref:Branched-chain amino acid ABC transporter permease n=1 Tax=Rhodovastum atsumiense TaxID=504468 RepID=A0A5M6IPX0_9PROT|nr:branched-chain amino acid ABC transporter permease [Rhodovastum atsumiense]KAA5610333.1 branched-chain amino acid ABC transporter permease [Rhodovastum atsumiense]CAH2600927.1 Branched-chain amino acid ABC transporter permease [Rhodovastum atsumiense]